MIPNAIADLYDENALAYLFENARVGLAMCRAEDNVLVMVNPAFASMHGYSVCELIGANPGDVFAPECLNRLADYEGNALAGCATNDVSFETVHLRKDGSSFPVHVHITAIKDAQNRIQHRIANVQDISGRYALQHLSEAKDQLLSSILDSSADIVTFAINSDYQYLAFNRQHQSIMKNLWGKDIRLGQSIFEVIGSKDDANQAKASFDRALKGESFSVEQRYGDVKHGRQDWQVFYAPIYDAQHRVFGISCFNLNVSKKKETDRLMHLLLTSINASSDSVFLIDTDTGKFLYVNRAATSGLGYSQDELLGMAVMDVDPNYSYVDWVNHVDCLRKEQHLRFETLHKSKAGKVYPVEVKAHYVFYDGVEYNLAITKDISEKKRYEKALLESHEEYKSLSENSPDLIIRYNLQGERIYVNPMARLLFGSDQNELLGSNLDTSAILSKESIFQLKEKMSEVVKTGRIVEFETRYSTDKVVVNGNEERIPKGVQIGEGFGWGFNKLIPEYDDQGKINSVLLIGRDITELKRAQNALEIKEREFRNLVESTPDTICRYNEDCIRIYANPAMQRLIPSHIHILGTKPTDIGDTPSSRAYEAAIREVFISGKASAFELEWQDSSGHNLISQIHIVPEFSELGDVHTVLAVGRDVTQQKNHEYKIQYIANHDSLTGLFSKSYAQKRSISLMGEADQSGCMVAFVFIDLDGFKAVNDTLGHSTGDLLLREVACRLNAELSGDEVLSRQGGDEFLMILPCITAEADVIKRIADLQNILIEPINVLNYDLRIAMSVGVAFYPTHGQSFDELLKKSDTAMYRSKDMGKNTCTIYSEEIDSHSIEKLTIQNEIQFSLERNDFELYYQPQIDIHSGKLIGAEALIRWIHPEKGMISPDDFIPIAELSGSIIPLGEWVVHEACRQIAHWQTLGIYLKVAVNVSAVQLKKSNLGKIVADALQQTNIDPKWLELELTESGMMHDSDNTLKMIQQISAMGVQIAIDDFGTGYSSLAYLKRFSLDKLKIDKCFITNLLSDNDDYMIVQAIIQMSKSLKLKTVAEGVETTEVLGLLQNMGCDIAQGYYFSKPLSSVDFNAFIRQQDK